MATVTLYRWSPAWPLSLTRAASALIDRWDAWRERSAQRRALEALSRLDPRILRDLGLEEGYASRAAAFGAARAQRDAGASLATRIGAW